MSSLQPIPTGEQIYIEVIQIFVFLEPQNCLKMRMVVYMPGF